MTSTPRMKLLGQGGWGSEAKVSSVGGMNIFWNYTLNTVHEVKST